ncbi:hypothetical protein Cni_G07167 [Canna indica]|uniref:Zinc finger PMZ-type domain-containing protein n=1 Tax=Canna indica TaxID=4628 RepID=A0AAQ3Q6N3_9LILI|nr:hypothetical protein Cni_G07167 [Canna indica]
MNELQAISSRAHEDFISVGVNKLCQAYISTSCKCDDVSNNISETSNGYILTARSKPIIDMLEDIRRMLMARISWDLSGIPCYHAISCIFWLKEEPENYVDNYFKIETYLKTYEVLLQPLTGKDTWPQVEGPHILPPPVKKMPGRPKKKRRRDMHEEDESSTRLTRRGITITCHPCNVDGHNIRSCSLRGQSSSSRTHTEGQDDPASMRPTNIGTPSTSSVRRGRTTSGKGGRTTSGRGDTTSTMS